MRVKLIDVDSKIPNFALMQLSAYHKSLGDTVGFDISNPDLVYISCIFTKNREKAMGLSTMFPDAEVSIGGTGINLHGEIPNPAQHMKPDYDLYKMDYSLGFTTRGCIRHCPFCFVPEKEGTIHRAMHIKDFHDAKFKKVHCLDNNIYADKEWFFENTQYLLDNKLSLKVPQGMDIRLLNEEIAARLKEIKWECGMSFAFDNITDEKAVRNGIDILKQAGINLQNHISFYVLAGFNTTFEQDVYRVKLLRELGVNSFVMPYRKDKSISLLARYANRRWIYWSCEFEDYQPYKNYIRGGKNGLACNSLIISDT